MFFLADYCGDLKPIIKIVAAVVKLLQFGIPIILIVMGMLDLGKAVLSSKEDEMKKAQGILIRRIIYAVAVFLVVTIVTLVMNMVADADDDDNMNASEWKSCWKTYGP